MKNLAEGIRILVVQLDKLREIPKSNKLHVTISGIPGIMKEVVDPIEKWFKSWASALFCRVGWVDDSVCLCLSLRYTKTHVVGLNINGR